MKKKAAAAMISTTGAMIAAFGVGRPSPTENGKRDTESCAPPVTVTRPTNFPFSGKLCSIAMDADGYTFGGMWNTVIASRFSSEPVSRMILTSVVSGRSSSWI